MVPQIGETLARGYQIGSPFEDGPLTPAPACGMVGALLHTAVSAPLFQNYARPARRSVLGFLFSAVKLCLTVVSLHILPG